MSSHLKNSELREPTDRQGSFCNKNDMGFFNIYSVPACRFVAESVTPEEMTEYFISKCKDENRKSQECDILYQDFSIDIKNPDPLIEKLMKEIVFKFAGSCGYKVFPFEMWTIVHQREHQTYPHSHAGSLTYMTMRVCIGLSVQQGVR